MGIRRVLSWVWGGRSPKLLRPCRTRLVGEQLENRWVPAGTRFLWSPDQGNNWTTIANWDYWRAGIGWVDCVTSYPGDANNTTAEVEFRPEENATCIADASVTIHSLKIFPEHTAPILVAGTLTISGLAAVNQISVVEMQDGTFRGTTAESRIVLAEAALFEWTRGSLVDITVDVQRATPQRTAGFNTTNTAAVNGPRVMWGSTLDVRGTLNWGSSLLGHDVQVHGPDADHGRSVIRIREGSSTLPPGQFNIAGQGAHWGDPFGGASHLKVENSGTVTVNMDSAAATAYLVADYDNYGTTTIERGVLLIGGHAEQPEGNFFFNLKGPTPADTTVRVLGNGQVLGIRGGSINGTGTVDAHLHLGNQNGTGSPVINPGVPANFGDPPSRVTPAIGTLKITKDFWIHAANARTNIEIAAAANGAMAGIDKIVVDQAAVLAGTLFVYAPTTLKPVTGDRYTFLTAADGILEDFAAKNLNSAGPFTVGTSRRFLSPDKKPTAYDLLVMQAPGN